VFKGLYVSNKQYPWLRLSFDLWRAGIEAQQVIGLRLANFAAGAAGTAEMNRMVSEKITTALAAQQIAAEGAFSGRLAGVPSRTLALYRRKMRANRRRLGKSARS
jgi:hypothetical protein